MSRDKPSMLLLRKKLWSNFFVKYEKKSENVTSFTSIKLSTGAEVSDKIEGSNNSNHHMYSEAKGIYETVNEAVDIISQNEDGVAPFKSLSDNDSDDDDAITREFCNKQHIQQYPCLSDDDSEPNDGTSCDEDESCLSKEDNSSIQTDNDCLAMSPMPLVSEVEDVTLSSEDDDNILKLDRSSGNSHIPLVFETGIPINNFIDRESHGCADSSDSEGQYTSQKQGNIELSQKRRKLGSIVSAEKANSKDNIGQNKKCKVVKKGNVYYKRNRKKKQM